MSKDDELDYRIERDDVVLTIPYDEDIGTQDSDSEINERIKRMLHIEDPKDSQNSQTRESKGRRVSRLEAKASRTVSYDTLKYVARIVGVREDGSELIPLRDFLGHRRILKRDLLARVRGLKEAGYPVPKKYLKMTSTQLYGYFNGVRERVYKQINTVN